MYKKSQVFQSWDISDILRCFSIDSLNLARFVVCFVSISSCKPGHLQQRESLRVMHFTVYWITDRYAVNITYQRPTPHKQASYNIALCEAGPRQVLSQRGFKKVVPVFARNSHRVPCLASVSLNSHRNIIIHIICMKFGQQLLHFM